jgi:putative YphP/YqiW family bacilliredoxin
VKGRRLEFDHLVTVFAGMETEAVRRVREHFGTLAPSSPNVAIFRDGKLVHHMSRSTFESYAPPQIANQIALAHREM